MTLMSAKPQTPTGKRLWERLTPYYPPVEYDGWAEWVATIESEAARQAIEPIAAEPSDD
jgi:hypothetical protein